MVVGALRLVKQCTEGVKAGRADDADRGCRRAGESGEEVHARVLLRRVYTRL